MEDLERRTMFADVGQISGTVFADHNGDGTKQVAEPALANWTVYLDANNNARLDGGETFVVTDGGGNYTFTNLPANQQYMVRTEIQPGYAQTSTGGAARPAAISRPGRPVAQPILRAADVQPPPAALGTNYSKAQIVANLAGRRALTDLNAYLLANPNSPVKNLFDLSKSRQLLRPAPNETIVRLALRPGVNPKAAVQALAALSITRWASLDTEYDRTRGDPRDFTPNDPQAANQYHHALMHNPQAWDFTLGDPNLIVAVIDDGIDMNHQDLAAGLWTNADEIAGNGIDDDANGYIDDTRGWDFWDSDNNPTQDAFSTHGNHVTGIVGARINNGVGVAGVAGGVTIMPIRFFGTSGNTWTASMVAQSYAYAADNGAKIVNTSYGVDEFVSDPVFVAGVQYLYSHGVLHFNSAGNTNTPNPVRQTLNQTFYVANTSQSDAKFFNSNYGTGIDLSAPGVDILSTLPNNNYGLFTGSSMSTPNAAGAAALIWSIHPTWTRDQVAAQLIGSADNIDAQNPFFVGLLGAGRVNSFRAVSETLGGPKLRMNSLTLPAEGAITTQTPTNFTLDVASVFDPATVNNINNWALVGDGPDNTFGTADDHSVSLTLNTNYMIAGNRLSFSVTGMMTADRYRFTGGTGLKNPFGTTIDGNADGTSGDAFTRTFTLGPVAGAYFVTLNPNDNVQNVSFGNFPTSYSGSEMKLQLDPTGTRVQVWIDTLTTNPPTYTAAKSINTALSFNGAGGSDALTIDYRNGNPMPDAGVSFSGGGGTDTLAIIGSLAADNVLFGVNSAELTGTIAHSGVEAIQFDGLGGNDIIAVNAGPNVAFTATQHLQSLAVAGGATASVTSGGSKVIVTKSLSIIGTGKFDLIDNDMIVDYDGASQLGVVQTLINAARGSGLWLGNGLTSSAARDASPRITTLGAMEATEYKALAAGNTTFDSEPIDNTAVLIKYTYYGDANFSGRVNFDDYARIDAGFNNGRTGWVNGDFNGNGVVNFDDYSLIDLAFNANGPQLRPAPAPIATPGRAKTPVTPSKLTAS